MGKIRKTSCNNRSSIEEQRMEGAAKVAKAKILVAEAEVEKAMLEKVKEKVSRLFSNR